ncbi:MAG: aminoglycoside phosphotransferase family protein [Actinomycetota bacterium]
MVDMRARVATTLSEPGAPELAALLQEVVGTRDLLQVSKLKVGVYRFAFEVGGGPHSLVAKRLAPDRAQRNRLVAERWLPAVGLAAHGPSLLGAVALPDCRYVWHLYEDVGPHTLEDESDVARIEAAVNFLTQLHGGFVGHPLLAECRVWGEDHGIDFYRSSVGDAITALRALRPPGFIPDPGQARLRDRLLARLDDLWAEAEGRVEISRRAGEEETMLHGDLWLRNMFVLSGGDELLVRLIDWDHVGVGSPSYDLSIFLLRFPVEDRKQILDAYEHAASRGGGAAPERADLNVIFETAELARVANRLIWPALAAHDGNSGWAFEELATVETWFEALDARVPL